jgi:UDP-glucose 4-epimerase
MKLLVTGGAGYIGSAFVKEAVKNHEVVVIDNLSKGKKELVDKRAKFFKIDLIEKEKLDELFKKEKFECVVHFAAYKAAGESMKDPVKYSDNITSMINLLNAMAKENVKKIIFSSTAAVYGPSEESVSDEESKTNPLNYYGFTKLKCEELIKWYSKINGIAYIIFRYFNVAGDAGLKYQDPQAENVFPIIMDVLMGKRQKFVIFGEDYDTPDGTCIRDYIDVNDLVDAHILALNADYNGIVNLGTGKGCSVKELVGEFIKITGRELKYEIGPRRPGDTASLVASNKKALEVLGWSPKRSIGEMIRTTYEAYGLKN